MGTDEGQRICDDRFGCGRGLVVDPASFSARFEEACVLERREVLGDRRVGEVNQLDELANAAFLIQARDEQSDAVGIGEGVGDGG